MTKGGVGRSATSNAPSYLKRDVWCEPMEFRVEAQSAEAEWYTVAATLCSRTPVEGRTLQVLLAGATYSQTYWNFPLDPGRYSYVFAQTAYGIPTLSLDRIGTGDSDRPEATSVSSQASAYIVHQIVTELRAGTLRSWHGRRIRPSKVVLVGHSLGSAVATIEAATYFDVDGLILTGILHSQGPQATALSEQLYPAVSDPAFAADPPPEGYLTTIPGSRQELFYAAEDSDPAVVVKDEQTKSFLAVGELLDVATAGGLSMALQIPVLLVVGDHDWTYCQAPSCSGTGALASERSFFAPNAPLTVAALARAGHSINLHNNAWAWFRAAATWTRSTIGRCP